jgi:SAM-dependent methyltransferase
LSTGLLLLVAAVLVWAALRHVGRQADAISERIRAERDGDFDARHGVDTDGEIPIEQFGLPPDVVARAERYMPTDQMSLFDAVAFAGIDPARFTFIDLGCGKGRALIMASELKFRRVIGAEIVPELADVARANLARLGATAEVWTMDAMHFVFPPGPVVLFLYNPFNAEVIEAIIAALRTADPPALFIVYKNPRYGSLLESCGFLTSLGSPQGRYVRSDVQIWRRADQMTAP